MSVETLLEKAHRNGKIHDLPAGYNRKAFGDGGRAVFRHEKAAMTSVTGTAGGYLVPPELWLGVETILSEEGLFHKLAQCRGMSSRTLDIPSFDITASHATGDSPLFGGLGLRWTQEGSALTELEPSFAQGELKAQELGIYLLVSNQLVQDGGEPLAVYLEYGFACAIEFAVERYCFQGTGVGQIAGILTSPATALVNRVTASHVAQLDLATMITRLIPASYKRAIWACHPYVMADLATLAAYRVNAEEPRGEGLCGYLYGRPLYVTEKLPPIGTKGDVVLFDPKMYMLGTRQIEIAASPYDPTAFGKNQVVYRLLWRGDGQPLPRGTVTLADGSSTAGCFVVLN